MQQMSFVLLKIQQNIDFYSKVIQGRTLIRDYNFHGCFKINKKIIILNKIYIQENFFILIFHLFQPNKSYGKCLFRNNKPS